ncbi:MAG: hypothetical protein KBD15_00910 [Candidatus Magasanikbacteria bacterium]|jgi:hypothetical protein|nr:hypothetical protein [Candidatus Magasanikbacteria bacterium]
MSRLSPDERKKGHQEALDRAKAGMTPLQVRVFCWKLKIPVPAGTPECDPPVSDMPAEILEWKYQEALEKVNPVGGSQEKKGV